MKVKNSLILNMFYNLIVKKKLTVSNQRSVLCVNDLPEKSERATVCDSSTLDRGRSVCENNERLCVTLLHWIEGDLCVKTTLLYFYYSFYHFPF